MDRHLTKTAAQFHRRRPNKSSPLVTECRSPMSPAAFSLRHTSSFRFSFPGILPDELWRRLAANLSRYGDMKTCTVMTLPHAQLMTQKAFCSRTPNMFKAVKLDVLTSEPLRHDSLVHLREGAAFGVSLF